MHPTIKNDLPYGMWICANGREVLFNRRYQPIAQRLQGHTGELADHSEWVPWTSQHYFYADGSARKSTLLRVLDLFMDGQPIATYFRQQGVR